MLRTVSIALLVIFILPLSSLGADADTRVAMLAREKGKPVLVQFGDGQCPPCILQETYIKRVKKQVGDKVIFEFAHVRDEAPMTLGYKVWTTPTLLFLNAQGEEVERNIGVLKTKALKKKLAELGWID